MEKLDKYQYDTKNIYNTRFFNKLSISSDNKLITKEAIHQYGYNIINIEKKYYKIIQDMNLPYPKIYENSYNNKFTMENINGVPIKYILNDNNINTIIDNIFTSLNKIHNSLSNKYDKNIINNDIFIEFNDKIINRINTVKPLLSHFNYITHINNLIIDDDFNYIINDLYHKINDHFSSYNEYTIIHGDCQFSNILLDNSNNIIFIDPRGYFGNTFLFGLKYYDYSKILYSLSGYDYFNDIKNYYFDIIDNNIILNIKNIDLLNYKYIFDKYNIDFNICLYMCIIHWFGLSSYISNNILKSVAAYYNAIYLYNKYIKNMN